MYNILRAVVCPIRRLIVQDDFGRRQAGFKSCGFYLVHKGISQGNELRHHGFLGRRIGCGRFLGKHAWGNYSEDNNGHGTEPSGKKHLQILAKANVEIYYVRVIKKLSILKNVNCLMPIL
jgi:hypothetical protein